MIESRVVGGRYLLLAELTRGGFGPAFRAEDRITGRQVVVTEIRIPDADRPDALRERLLREVRAAGRLRHPAVVPVQDLVADRGPDGSLREYLVTERPEARSVSELTADGPPLGHRRVAAIGRDVLAGLRVMHAGGMVHGGLSPDCVLVDADGRALVTDIGLARAVGPRASGFDAPERSSGTPDGPATDLWGLGAVLRHVTAAQPPTGGPLAEAIARLTADDPADRITADEAGDLLDRAARPRPATGDLGRSRRLLLVVAAVLLVVVVALVLAVAVF